MDKSADKVWLVTADAGRARIFRADSKLDTLVQIEEMVRPTARLKSSELVSDRAGRVNTGGDARSAMDPRTDPHELEETKAAHDLAVYLHEAFAQGRFNELFLVASPAFLGKLRKDLSAEVARTIVATLDRDYTKHQISDVHRHVRTHLQRKVLTHN